MIFDTDVFIWVQRGNEKAMRIMEKEPDRFLSVQTYLELLQGAKNKKHHEYTRSFLKDFDFKILPLSENIGHRASVYVEAFALSHGIQAGDALIAATATVNNLVLCSSNVKHFKIIPDLKLKTLKP